MCYHFPPFLDTSPPPTSEDGGGGGLREWLGRSFEPLEGRVWMETTFSWGALTNTTFRGVSCPKSNSPPSCGTIRATPDLVAGAGIEDALSCK